MSDGDRKSSVAIGIIGAVLFLFSVSIHFAFASVQDGETGGFSRPAGTEIGSPVKVHFYGNEYDFGNNSTAQFFDACLLGGACSYRVRLYSGDSGYFSGACHTVVENQYIDYTDNVIVPIGTALQFVILTTYTTNNCDGGSVGAEGVYDYDGGATLFTIVDTNDFFGTTTGASFVGDVTTGVQNTMVPILPAVGLVGVPIAFLLGRKVVTLIRAMV